MSNGEVVERTRFHNETVIRERIARDEKALENDGGLDVTSAEEQLGRPLYAFEVQTRLLALNQNLLFEKSIADPSKYGIYIVRSGPDPATGKGTNHRQFICGMEAGVSPQRSVRAFKEEKIPHPTEAEEWLVQPVPIGEKARGWMTVLMRLIRERVITRAGAERMFDITLGTSRNWQQLTT